MVWITGASSGIGEALALAFAAEGAELVLSARDNVALRDVAARCRSRAERGVVAAGGAPRRAAPQDTAPQDTAPPDTAPQDVAPRDTAPQDTAPQDTAPPDVVPLDLAELDRLPRTAAAVIGRHGRVDIMVHNAGVAHRALAVDTPLEIDRRIMDVDHFGAVALTKALLPGMLERGAGCFVVVGSLSAKYGAPLVSAYAAAKHALLGFFESLRTEVESRGVQITVVIPGFIRTPIAKRALTGTGEPFGRDLSVHERGMSAEACAAKILRAVERRRAEVLIGGGEVATVWLHRLFPGLLSRLVRSHPVRTRERWLARLGLRRKRGRSGE